MPQNWPLTLCRLIVTSQDDVTAKLISNLFWFSLTWRNWIFAWLTKIATELSLTVTHHWFWNGGKTRTRIKRECWPNTSYFLNKSYFSNCSLLFDTPCREAIYCKNWHFISLFDGSRSKYITFSSFQYGYDSHFGQQSWILWSRQS